MIAVFIMRIIIVLIIIMTINTTFIKLEALRERKPSPRPQGH